MAKSSSNAFSIEPPEKDLSGQTAEEFLRDLFEFETCAECGYDIEDHTAVISPVGLWFAFCLKGESEA